MMQFKKATKEQSRLRMALLGPAGSGKTYTALKLATALGDRVAVIDTERGSASLYSDQFDFDVLELDSFQVQNYIDGIAAAKDYDVLVIDSLSHAWAGKGGLLEFVDEAARRSKSGSSFHAWRDATPLHNKLIDAMLEAKPHVIVTMRTKMDHVQEKDERGRTVIRKVGMQPVQRDGLEYEFSIVMDLDTDHVGVVSKSRCAGLADTVWKKPGADLATEIRAWLTTGTQLVSKPTPEPPADLELQRQRRRWSSMKQELGLSNEFLAKEAAKFSVSLADATGEQMKQVLDHIQSGITGPEPEQQQPANIEGDF